MGGAADWRLSGPYAYGARRGAAGTGHPRPAAADDASVVMDRASPGHWIAPVREERGRRRCRPGARLPGHAQDERRRDDAVRAGPHDHLLALSARVTGR